MFDSFLTALRLNAERGYPMTLYYNGMWIDLLKINYILPYHNICKIVTDDTALTLRKGYVESLCISYYDHTHYRNHKLPIEINFEKEEPNDFINFQWFRSDVIVRITDDA